MGRRRRGGTSDRRSLKLSVWWSAGLSLLRRRSFNGPWACLHHADRHSALGGDCGLAPPVRSRRQCYAVAAAGHPASLPVVRVRPPRHAGPLPECGTRVSAEVLTGRGAPRLVEGGREAETLWRPSGVRRRSLLLGRSAYSGSA